MDVRLFIEKGARQQREIRLKSEDTIIGRRAGCDLRVPSASVSRRHCRLSFRDDCLMVEDLQSANGTFLNGVRVKDTQEVRPGDRLEVGPVTFLIKYQAVDQEDLVALELDVEEIVPEFDMDEIAVDEAQENKPKKKRKKTIAEHKTVKEAPAEQIPKKPPEKPADSPPQEEENLPIAFDESSWQMPAGEDIRDILSQMDDS